MVDNQKFEKLYTAFMATYEATQDTTFLIQAYKLWKEGKIEVKDVDHHFEVPAFYKVNKYGKTCCRCGCTLGEDAVFKIKDRNLNKNKYWCLACATPEEKQDTYYQNWTRQEKASGGKAQPSKSAEPMRYMPNSPNANANGFVDYLTEED